MRLQAFLLLVSFQWSNSLHVAVSDAVESADRCAFSYKKVGCFKDDRKNPRPVPVLVFTDRDVSSDVWSGKTIGWPNWDTYIVDLVCRCANESRARNYSHFSIQYYGECWSGSDAAKTYDRAGPSESCLTKGVMQKCNVSDDVECVGEANTDFVYEIKEKAPTTIPPSPSTFKSTHRSTSSSTSQRLTSPTSSSTPAAIGLRLIGGRGSGEGRVEIYYRGSWGTVCDYRWDIDDARVVCRQLGYPHAISAPNKAFFGQGSGKIWLHVVQCQGDESSIVNCPHSPWGVHGCGHHEDASVICSSLRLIGGSWPGEGRVEIYYRGSWGTVCDDDWDINDARVVCRQLGYSSAVSAPQSARFGQGSGRIWLDDVQCQGYESSIGNCRHRPWGVHDCSHREDASVICSIPTLRLIGGSGPREGRVEIYYRGSWGTVCDDGWDINDARVVCRQLGYSSAVSAPQSAWFGQGSGKIWLDDVQCQGNETSIVNCRRRPWGVHNCGHHEDASVICSGVDDIKPSAVSKVVFKT